MKTLALPSGRAMPVLGQGTWNMGEDPSARAREVAALRLGLDLGTTLIDTAEMYAEGGAEEVVAVIPKAVQPDHVRANRAALDLVLTEGLCANRSSPRRRGPNA